MAAKPEPARANAVISEGLDAALTDPVIPAPQKGGCRRRFTKNVRISYTLVPAVLTGLIYNRPPAGAPSR